MKVGDNVDVEIFSKPLPGQIQQIDTDSGAVTVSINTTKREFGVVVPKTWLLPTRRNGAWFLQLP